ncbi:MAG: nucleotidyltransferase domain-containing protein [Ignavibacteria bacterium]|jgi:hypothetical protein|nr:nucleotidyltransferase domain-containing protein [Ignavibacteria bacterium]
MNDIKEKILSVLKNHPVSKAGIFGSYSDNTYRKESDIDILIELSEEISLIDFVGIKLELEETLNKKVDLVEYSCIKPIIKDNILGQEIRIL